AQGDAAGWVTVAAEAAGLPSPTPSLPWRDHADYQEGAPGIYLANAIAAAQPPGAKTFLNRKKSAHRPRFEAESGARRGLAREAALGTRRGLVREAEFGTRRGLVRRARDPGSGLDSAAAWAVRPFPRPALFPAVRRTLLRLVAKQTRFGITPGEAWAGTDPWTAPTAWSAWSLAALAGHGVDGSSSAARDRRAALRLLGDLRRAATPAGALPERVDAQTGIPVSTTPLAWSHAFAILALRQLWPTSTGASSRGRP